MKVSIITVCYNSGKTIESTIQSILAQDYSNLEYIVVDGGSKDDTLQILQKYRQGITTLISEPDQGMYDAMNKGIRAASGEVIGILNSDDFFYNEQVIPQVAKAFRSADTEATIGDIIFIKEGSEKVLRKYSARNWSPSRFAWGFMPPHPSFFVRQSMFEQFGFYKTDYQIAADYELLIRFLLVHQIRWKYLPIITTKMRMGGTSTQGLKSLYILNKEIARACKENGVYTNYGMIYSKYLYKPLEFLRKD